MFDHFATQVTQLNVSTHYPAQEILEATKNSYLKFRSKTNDDIHSLCTKAVDIMRMRIINSYYQNIPQHDNSTSAKRISIGMLCSSNTFLKFIIIEHVHKSTLFIAGTSTDTMTKRSKG